MIARSWDGRFPRRHSDGFHQHLLTTGVADSAKIAGGWSTPRRPDSAPWTTPSSSTTSRPAKASRNPPPSAARSPPPMLPCYSWGDGCAGWRLVDTTGLSVIEERMPPGTAEEWYVHDHARQYFHVLDGQATMRTPDGEIDLHAGTGVQIAPGTPHQMANTSDRDLRLLAISAPTARSDRRPRPEPLQIGEQA